VRHKLAATIDPLTGLPNRRAFLNDAEHITRKQAASGRPVAVFIADLDLFKRINDTYGHALGDRVLRLFGEVALANLRSSDVVGRLGGEEVAMLISDANHDNAYLVAERIRAAFETAAMTVDDQPIGATISIGVAVIQDPSHDLATLLEEADQALYRAKNQGRNRVELSAVRSGPEIESAPDMGSQAEAVAAA
jgi:diguanylate cyclase (GGDEF)-like protein